MGFRLTEQERNSLQQLRLLTAVSTSYDLENDSAAYHQSLYGLGGIALDLLSFVPFSKKS